MKFQVKVGDINFAQEISEENSFKDNNTKDIEFKSFNDLLPNTYLVKTSNGLPFESTISLGEPEEYSKSIPGITTFRGNNYRDSATYGIQNIVNKTLEKKWTRTNGNTDNWTGVGWNGQPAIVKWNDTLKSHMNLYDEFKEKENFIEVIYGTLDSNVHFYDLETGSSTRPSIKLNSSIKGSVTIDPRGYPLLYVGQGINEVSGESVPMGYHIYSLIDGKELLFIDGRDNYAYSGWGAFDGNPIIDSETDTLILPGENGIIYIVKLNTLYNESLGTISIDPNITRYKYTVNSKTGGTENAIAIYKNYAFFLNNNGLLQCLDLKTLTPVWFYEMGDDCDATIAIEEEKNSIVLYAATEVDRRMMDSPAYVRKFKANTGELIWEYSCDCIFDADVNGGVLSSPVLGKNSISNMVIFNFSKVTNKKDGKMVALDKENGSIIWEKDLTYYSWSSPVAIYNEKGDAYIIFCNSVGQVLLIGAKTGETLYTLNTGGGNIEGSPAVYENIFVIGTRGKRIYGIEIK